MLVAKMIVPSGPQLAPQRCAVEAAERDRRAAGDRDLLQRGDSIEEADPLAVRRDERPIRRAEPGERRGVELIERAHEECRAVGADVDDARAIRREGQSCRADRRSAPPRSAG